MQISPPIAPAEMTFVERILYGVEQGISVHEARRHPAFQRDGRDAPKELIYRLMSRGRAGVTLDNCMARGGRVTSREAIERFHLAINDKDRTQAGVARGVTERRSTAASARAHRAAMQQLQAAGLVKRAS